MVNNCVFCQSICFVTRPILIMSFVCLPLELDTLAEPASTRGAMKGNISSDGIIDDDFETELGGNEAIVRSRICERN